MRRMIALMTVAAIMAVMAASPAVAQGEPVGSCPPGYTLFTVEEVHEHVADPNGEPSWDPNGDGYTCVKFIANKAQGGPPSEGQRVAIVDNSKPL
jgi:hypothetical protein